MLKGKNILLKSMEKKDINTIYEFLSDQELRKYDCNFIIIPSKEWFVENWNNLLTLNKRYLTITNKKNCIVGYITYEQVESCCDVYDIGITIGREFWNRGYGKDSINTLLEFLFMNRGAERVELEVSDFNFRAINCYKECGFIKEGEKRHRIFNHGKYSNLVIMGIIRKEYMEKINEIEIDL